MTLLLSTMIIISASMLGVGTLTVNPCQYYDGTSQADFGKNFVESYGAADHLPSGEIISSDMTGIRGFARAENDSFATGPNSFVLRLIDNGGNRFYNGTEFNFVDTYVELRITRGVGYLQMKQGIDREIMNVYNTGVPGTTGGGQAILFTVECRPDNSTFEAKNYTALSGIIDVNDNFPVFYNASTNLKQSMFFSSVRENTPLKLMVFEGVEARDLDLELNALTRVSVLENPYFRTEAPNSSAVRLVTKRRIPAYDSFGVAHPTLSIILIAVDSPSNASMALTSTATVVFAILKDGTTEPIVVLWPLVVAGCFAAVLAVAFLLAYLRSRRRRTLFLSTQSEIASTQSLLGQRSTIISINDDTMKQMEQQI